MSDLVPVAPIREAFERSGMTCNALALAAGFDESHVARILGGRVHYVYRNGRRVPCQRYHVSYDGAVRLIRAMNLDPVDLGL